MSFLFVSHSSESVSIADAVAGAGSVAVMALPEFRQRIAHVFLELLLIAF